MTVSNGDILKVVLQAVLPDGTQAENVYYLIAALAAPYADQSILNALETWIETAYTHILGAIVDDVAINDLVCDVIEWQVDHWETVYHVGTEAVDLAPTSVDDWLPNQVSPFATFNTTRPKSKGRKFLYGFSDLAVVGGYLTAAVVTDIADYAADIMDVITLAPLNTLTPGIVRSTEDTFLAFLSAVVTNVVGTQRRRRPGVGV